MSKAAREIARCRIASVYEVTCDNVSNPLLDFMVFTQLRGQQLG